MSFGNRKLVTLRECFEWLDDAAILQQSALCFLLRRTSLQLKKLKLVGLFGESSGVL